MILADIIHESKNGVILEVLLSPRASKDKILGVHNGRLKIGVTAPPVDGKANAALCKFLAKTFKVPPSTVSVIRGQTSREKSVEITDSSLEEVLAVLDLKESSN